jgi:Ca2+/Na+ antiporter
MNFSESLGSFGVSILLIAFVLNLLKIIRTDSLIYSLLNFAGAGIACYASYLIPYFPFVILEGVWTILSLVAVVKTIVRMQRGAPQTLEETD